MKIKVDKKTVLIPFEEYKTLESRAEACQKYENLYVDASIALKKVVDKYGMTTEELNELIKDMGLKVLSQNMTVRIHLGKEDSHGIILTKIK